MEAGYSNRKFHSKIEIAALKPGGKDSGSAEIRRVKLVLRRLLRSLLSRISSERTHRRPPSLEALLNIQFDAQFLRSLLSRSTEWLIPLIDPTL